MIRRVPAPSAWLSVGALVVSVGALTPACASAPPQAVFSPELAPTSLDPSGPAEQEVLARAPQLPVNEEVDVAGLRVRAAAPYTAASGRLCRALDLNQQPRLMCEGPEGWVFVPILIEGP